MHRAFVVIYISNAYSANKQHTDPVRMRRLYPDLGGAHPLVRSRNIISDDIQEYLQFGTSFLINAQQHSANGLSFGPIIRSLVDIFILRKATRTVLHTTTLQSAPTLMDWPHLQAHLRSDETFPADSKAPHDQRAKIPVFWVKMSQLLMRDIYDRRKIASTATQDNGTVTIDPSNGTQVRGAVASSSSYSGFQFTTLDAGGDCHRQPIVKVTARELQGILAADVCFVTAGNDTFRHLNCTSRGKKGQQQFVLATTSLHNIENQSAFYAAKKLFKRCDSEEILRSRTGNTKIYVWNQQTQSFEPNTVRDETSLSKRVRISPIWNMLARLRGVAAQQDLEPSQVWEKTDPRRHENPRWTRNADKGASQSAIWDTDWVFTNTDPQCSNVGFGRISQNDWYNNPRKADTCLSIAQAFSRERGLCLKELANSFDICQIDQLKDFCGAVQNIRAEVRQVNAVANQYTLLHKNLYLPSRYLKQDGMFGWSAIVETYNTIDPELVANPATCPGIHKLLQNAAASSQENQECPATWLFKTSNFLEKVRNIVSSVVTIIVLAQNVVTDGIVFFLSVMAQDKGMMKEKVNAMTSGLKSIVVKMLAYYGEMLRLLWTTITMQEGVFKSISDFIKKLCDFVRKMTLMALKLATSFINAMKKVLPFVSEFAYEYVSCPSLLCLFYSI